LACTSTVLGEASDDDDDEGGVLALVFMVAVFAADAIEDGTSTFTSSSGAFAFTVVVVLALKASVVSEIPST
jgi:hypothetical protein